MSIFYLKYFSYQEESRLNQERFSPSND